MPYRRATTRRQPAFNVREAADVGRGNDLRLPRLKCRDFVLQKLLRQFRL
jgi:hypothetical protein